MKKRDNKIKNAKMSCCPSGSSCTGGGYFLGFIGAAIFYIQGATSFWNGVLGVLKALVWPAFLVHKLFGF